MTKLYLQRFYAVSLSLGLALLLLLSGCGGSAGSIQSPPPPPPPPPPPAAQVLTYHNDSARTGLNPNETVLTPGNVNVGQFGKLFTYGIDGYPVAQPLYMANLSVPNHGTLNVVFVATEHDSVYAFDAAGKVGSALWHVSFINPAAGITTVSQAEVNSTIYPEIGITSTPVIDASAGTIYVEALTKENGNYVQRLHALDVATGNEKAKVVIGGSVPGSGDGSVGGAITFDPKLELQRSALLLNNGKIYVAFASHGDTGPYHGWVMSFDAATLQPAGIWNVSPDGNAAGIWMSGDGLAADANGNIFGVSGNGNYNVSSGGRNYGDTVFKLAPDLSTVSDFFTPFDQQTLAANDEDMGSGGVLLLPDQPGAHPHLAIATNKGGSIYVVDRDSMGHFHAGDNSQIVQTMQNALGTGSEDRNFSSPAFWNNFIYLGGSFDKLEAFQLTNGQLAATPTSQTTTTFGFQGCSPVISSNGTGGAIVWAIDQTGGGILHAYDATDLSKELWNSTQNATRDGLDSGVAHFAVPTVVNGKVYVGTHWKLVVYGLL